MTGGTVLYDDDCGFCRWSADKLRAWDRHGLLTFAPIQGPAGRQLLSSLDPDTRLDAWHFVEPDGRIWSAGRAVPRLLAVLPFGAPLAVLAELSPTLTEHAYRSVAKHRGRLGRLLGQEACAVDPSRGRA